jgi:hypothetical protein
VFKDPDFKEKIGIQYRSKEIRSGRYSRAILFLVSTCRHITGETLNVKGGAVLAGGEIVQDSIFWYL